MSESSAKYLFFSASGSIYEGSTVYSTQIEGQSCIGVFFLFYCWNLMFSSDLRSAITNHIKLISCFICFNKRVVKFVSISGYL